MSLADHEWARELLPAHLAGGLTAEERARLEGHTATCAECIAELDALRRFDRGMDSLFEPVRARAGLEERIIRSLRAAPASSSPVGARKIITGLAAVIALGLVGFAVMSASENGPSITEYLSKEDAPRMLAGAQFRARPARDGVISSTEASVAPRPDPVAVASPADEPAIFFPEAKATDHNESEDAFSTMKGESLKGVPAQGGMAWTDRSKASNYYALDALREGRPAPSPAKGAPPPAAPAPEPSKESFYTYRPSPAAEKKAAETGAFLPERDLARVDPVAKSILLQTAAVGSGGGVGGKMKQTEEKLGEQKAGQAAPQEKDPTPPPTQARKIIRSGEMEFEVDSFDSAVVKIDTIAGEEQGAISTVNSEKLPNGKIRGTIILKVAPDHLGLLIVKLRALGDLKSQKLGSEDVTKAYYDLESRLRAARTMEERLLKIIKEGTGTIKDLLQVEKELGEWRIKIEAYEGERRYYDAMVAMSTLTIQLFEKEIRAAFGLTETERVDAGIEVEDVEKAHKDLTAAVIEAKGRVTKSDLKKLAAGQFSGILHFEIAPEAAGGLRDRLRQLGNVARLDVTTAQEAEGGNGRPMFDTKVKRRDTQFFVSLYNLANVAPRETDLVTLASVDAEAAYKAILKRVDDAQGRVKSSNLNQQKKDQVSGLVEFEVKAADAEPVLAAIKALGEVMSFQATENSDLANVTKSKRGFMITIVALASVQPRETVNVQLAARDVPGAYRLLSEALRKADARVFESHLNESDRRNISATFSFEIRRDPEKEFLGVLKDQGEIYSRTSNRSQDTQNVVDSKVRYDLRLFPSTNVPPRETVRLALETGKVDQALEAAQKLSAELKGRVSDPRKTRTSSGGQTAQVVLEIPLKEGKAAVQRLKALGDVTNEELTTNSAIPESELSTSRVELTISNEVIVPTDSAPWASIKKGLSVSLLALSWAITLVMIGVCFVGPIALLGWGGWRIAKRTRKPPASTT
jgi:hypothetical protein